MPEWNTIYLFTFFWVLEVLDVLDDIGEFLLVSEFCLDGGLLVLREGGVVHVHLLVGVHQVLVVRVGVAHAKNIKYYQTQPNSAL
jgi:hypothetical protein